MIKVSLVIPVFNMERYLGRCMQSLLIQTIKDFEIILVDDGSTDSSGRMCDQYAEKNPGKVKVIHKENGGISSARNAGMRIAMGKYVVFPDPDDWVEKDYIEQLMKIQEQEVQLVCCGYYVNYETKEIAINEGMQRCMMSGEEARLRLIEPPCMNGFAWNKLYHLDIIREHKLEFLSDVGTTEDLDFTFRYLKYCRKVCFAPEIRTYHYYQREGAITHSKFSRNKIASVNTYKKMIEDEPNSPSLVQAANEEICNIAINLLFVYKISDFNDVEIKHELKRILKNTLEYYLKSKKYGYGRKIQAILAYYCLPLYCIIKKMVTKEKIC